MDRVLFPDWILFSGIFLFLKLFNPTRLYLNNISSLAISAVIAMFWTSGGLAPTVDFTWVITVAIFAIFSSVPYFLVGMLGGIIQQLLLLNEQSVQDKRFIEETDSIAQMSSLVFLMIALDSGAIFEPLVLIIEQSYEVNIAPGFEELYSFIIDCLSIILMLSGKYIIIMLMVSFSFALIDIYFKKASFSMFVTSDIKAIAVIIALNAWLFSDVNYVYERLIGK
ncbi:type III secretion system apparatus protein VscT2 [Vibrio aquaticus]|uniref:Type III secretion system apparatus protein VscT2 n=1 Tax=Vibrio aquaticus TaxID=2496559 RepID=A0A3S0MLE0_9VIBR|nr:type III secretion system apparatus protein VscT2 [Vibrio aquaticus]